MDGVSWKKNKRTRNYNKMFIKDTMYVTYHTYRYYRNLYVYDCVCIHHFDMSHFSHDKMSSHYSYFCSYHIISENDVAKMLKETTQFSPFDISGFTLAQVMKSSHLQLNNKTHHHVHPPHPSSFSSICVIFLILLKIMVFFVANPTPTFFLIQPWDRCISQGQTLF